MEMEVFVRDYSLLPNICSMSFSNFLNTSLSSFDGSLSESAPCLMGTLPFYNSVFAPFTDIDFKAAYSTVDGDILSQVAHKLALI